MTDNDATPNASQPPPNASQPPPGRPDHDWVRRLRARVPVALPLGAVSLAAMLAVGAAAGAGGMKIAQRMRPQAVVLLQPASIVTVRSDSPTAIRGRVTDVFGNAFLLEDGTGRALVDTGPRGEGAPVVDRDEMVTVQGVSDRGRFHAQLIVHADGRSDGFGPPNGPREPRGPRDRGPRADGPPPPPPPGERPPGPRADRRPPPPPPGEREDRRPPPPPPPGEGPPGPRADRRPPPPPPGAFDDRGPPRPDRDAPPPPPPPADAPATTDR